MVGASERPHRTAPPPRRRAPRWGLSLHAAFTVLVDVLVAVVWATGGGEFWPVWVWFGTAIPVAVHALIFDARRRPPSRTKALVIHAQATGLVVGMLIVIWALSGFGAFWPAWALFGLAIPLGAHAIVAHRDRPPQARERELVERVDELHPYEARGAGRPGGRAAPIERDLHDGAQARLVSLSMLMGAEERLDGLPGGCRARPPRQGRGERGDQGAARPRSRDQPAGPRRSRPAGGDEAPAGRSIAS